MSTAEAGATGDDRPADGVLDELRALAVVATDLAFTITDARAADNPLVWVNPAFTRSTGYQAADVVGRNCRFLQGPGTDATSVDQIRQAVHDQVPLTTTLLNYRKDGTAFWNQLSISPVFDRTDRLVSFVGVQSDVTERVRANSERERAYHGERTARAESERARRRLTLLAEASRALSSTLDEDEILECLASLVVPGVADWVVLTLADDQGAIGRQLLRHRDGREELLERYSSLASANSTADSGIVRILGGSEPILIPDTTGGSWHSHTSSVEMVDAIVELGIGSVMYVPLLTRNRRVLGTMTLVSGPDGHRYDADDLEAAADLGWRAGTTLDNARLYEHEHHTAMTLQHSLLPRIGPIDGLHVATTYLPGETGADVGGDFYDLLALPDGRIAFAVGDVIGHDLAAAAAMGQLRGLLRAAAWSLAEEQQRGDAADVLDRVDRLVQGLGVTTLATLLFGLLERPSGPDAPWTLRYASAGHPAPLLRLPDGTVESLDAGGGLLIGVDMSTRRTSAVAEVPAGSVLVAYTDGLVERRGRHLSEGIGCVVQALSDTGPDDLSALTRSLVSACGDGREDDTALIAVRFEA